MATSLEELKVLQVAEVVADGIWEQVINWDMFPREVVGGQLARAADSIGANIAEAFGRFHYGEKLQFLYYARGSLFETKYWLNRALKRGLISGEQAEHYASQLSESGRQLNSFANNLKGQRHNSARSVNTIRETPIEYNDHSASLVSETDLDWLKSVIIVED
jgi:four helix bundle protein